MDRIEGEAARGSEVQLTHRGPRRVKQSGVAIKTPITITSCIETVREGGREALQKSLEGGFLPLCRRLEGHPYYQQRSEMSREERKIAEKMAGSPAHVKETIKKKGLGVLVESGRR